MCAMPPPAQCTIQASRMMARMIRTSHAKNSTIPGMAYPAMVLVLATAASYPPMPDLIGRLTDGLRRRRPGRDLETAPGLPADLSASLNSGELAGPRREPAVPAEVGEPAQDGHRRVVCALPRRVVQVSAAKLRERHPGAAKREPGGRGPPPRQVPGPSPTVIISRLVTPPRIRRSARPPGA